MNVYIRKRKKKHEPVTAVMILIHRQTHKQANEVTYEPFINMKKPIQFYHKLIHYQCLFELNMKFHRFLIKD